MYFRLKDSTSEMLARCRRHDELCNLPLDLIETPREAYDIQAAALGALGFERAGYSIVGSSEPACQALGLCQPVYAEIPAFAVGSTAEPFRLPQGTIGVQCELVFTFRRTYLGIDETVSIASLVDAISVCQPAITVLGRRTGRVFAGENAAIADFGLHVATLLCEPKTTVNIGALPNCPVNVFLFKEAGLCGDTSSIMGHPLNAVLWLARELLARGRPIQTGEFVGTGGCTKILKVHAGQHLAADFGPFGQVECLFS